MDKVYDHLSRERDVYLEWERSGGFNPDGAVKERAGAGREPFCIIMPPPNANDPLHLGHAMFMAVQDILVRYNRMRGKPTLWLPGTDHAGIETQYVFEKKLAKQGKSRLDFDRETLYRMIEEYVRDNSKLAVEQMKRLGASADWSRFCFTLDQPIVRQVLETFVELNTRGLIYRGERLVNYCTKCGTAYSELEVEYEERNDPLYYLRYGPFVIATARVETKFRDTALAVNPNDPRYKDYLGKTVEVEGLLGPIKLTVVADEAVDMEFGTGIMKVTPAHDPHDFELGKKYGLPVTPIIGFDGRMDFSWYIDGPDFINRPEKFRTRAKQYHGLRVAEARRIMAQHLVEDSLLERVDETYTHRVGVCYRCGTVIEPLPLAQFFVRVKPLVEKALAALDSKETVVLGAGREKILRQWLENLQDWNISRQLVWGIRMPVWYNIDNNPDLKVTFVHSGRKISGKLGDLRGEFSVEEINAGLQTIQAAKEAEYVIAIDRPGDNYVQETDTFDTWFSSGQWPVVTLRVPRGGHGGKSDFERFYPTTVMETGYDILLFWVTRMMLLGIFMTGCSPFKTVYLHGLVRDEKGQKMSKSKGNVINPVDMVDKYGADAIRMALVMSSTPGQDKSVGEEVIRGMRNFSNKIWNACRYVAVAVNTQGSSLGRAPGLNDQMLKQRARVVTERVTKLLDEYRVGLAAEVVYGEFWHWFCDEAIEEHKKGLVSDEVLRWGLETFLKLLHPFAPFVTEAAWQELSRVKLVGGGLLMTQSWPGTEVS